jgi:hypothetical protein
MQSGEPRRSAGLEADQEVSRQGDLPRRVLPCHGEGCGWTDEGCY